MENRKVYKKSFVSAVYVLAYVAVVAIVMSNGEKIFGGNEPENSVLAGVAILLLIVLSAAVVGSAIFLKPAMMFSDGEKKEALMLLTRTITWLVIFIVIIFGILAWL